MQTGLKKQLAEKDAKIKELTDTLQRLQAEFENYKKRAEKEKQEVIKFANSMLLKDFLSVLDSVEHSLANIRKNEKLGREEAEKGFEVFHKQLLDFLKSNGLKEIECIGKKFDPHLNEVVMHDKDEKKEDEIVLEELQKGYLINGKLLRTSKVKVNKIS